MTANEILEVAKAKYAEIAPVAAEYKDEYAYTQAWLAVKDTIADLAYDLCETNGLDSFRYADDIASLACGVTKTIGGLPIIID